MLKSVFFALPITLTACGAIYTSPKVSKSNSQVEIVKMTPYSVEFANETPYRPQVLPKTFSAIASTRVNLPKPVETLPTLPNKVQTSIPPNVRKGPYRIGVSDVLLLATPGPTNTDDLTGLNSIQSKRQDYTVQDDGSISVPDVGRVKVAGLTFTEAENAILQSLIDKQIDPTFSLEIAQFNSQKVAISGAVKNPTIAPISFKPVKLQDAILMAGGLELESQDYAVARINREGKTYQIPLQELRSNTSLQNINLQDGDTVFIDQDYRAEQARAYVQEKLALAQAQTNARAQSVNEFNAFRSAYLQKLELGAVKADYVYLTGEVIAQNRYRLPFNNKATLADALYSTNGIRNDRGDPAQIYVIRYKNVPDDKPITAYHVNGRDASNLLLATRFEMQPNDIIFVAEQKVTAWNRVISNILPSIRVADQVGN